MVAEGQFREDLYYRVKALQLHVPPLRARQGDILLLVQHFRREMASAGQNAPELSLRAWNALSQYAFPGNVRELRHAIQHAVVMSRGQDIELEHLPPEIRGAAAVEAEPDPAPALDEARAKFERDYVTRTLRLADGNRTRAAQMLGISRKTLWEKLRKYSLVSDDDE